MHPVAEQSATLLVRTIGEEHVPAWNEYAARLSSDSLFFRTEWDAPYQTYRLKVDRLASFRDGKIVGILPLVRQQSFLFGRHLVSLPWFDACGVAADDEQSRAALVAEAVSRAKASRIAEVQLRQKQPSEISPHVRTDKVLMELPLPKTPGNLWDSFKPAVRNQVRKGQKSGLTVQSGGAELLADFFAVYSENMRDLGSPAHHRRFFEAVLENFAAESTLHVTKLNRETVGAGLTMANGNAMEIPWASSLRKHNKLCVNHTMYWHMLERSCEQGFEVFRFGRSTPDSGTYRFKKQWGAKPVQLHWYLLPTDPDAVPDTAPPKDSYGRAAQMWTKLPVWAANFIGPKIIARVA